MKLAYKSLAKYYDLFFSQKDYYREVEFIKNIVNKLSPHAKSILDIGCGTGNHLNLLVNNFETLNGVDLNPEIIKIAMSKSKKIHYQVGSMVDFKVKSKFDVITCLYSVFNYNLAPNEAIESLKNFKNHLNPGGIVIVALYTPHNTEERIGINLGENKDIKVAKIDQYIYDPVSKIETSDFLVLIKNKGKIDFEIEKDHKFRIYGSNEFSEMCNKVGFLKIKYFDNFQIKSIINKSKHIIAVIQ